MRSVVHPPGAWFVRWLVVLIERGPWRPQCRCEDGKGGLSMILSRGRCYERFGLLRPVRATRLEVSAMKVARNLLNRLRLVENSHVLGVWKGNVGGCTVSSFRFSFKVLRMMGKEEWSSSESAT